MNELIQIILVGNLIFKNGLLVQFYELFIKIKTLKVSIIYMQNKNKTRKKCPELPGKQINCKPKID